MLNELVVARTNRSQAAYIRDQLRQLGMMWEDVDLDLTEFRLARHHEDTLGWVGLEFGGNAVLVRSLFISPQYRRRGIGQALVSRSEREAASAGASTAYVFSTGAGDFFRALGYRRTPLAATVDALRETPQVQWYLEHPDLLNAEVTYGKEL